MSGEGLTFDDRVNRKALTNAETERLVLLMEECAEVQQIVGKILRHGFESHHPDGGLTNRQLLETEIGDVCFAIEFLIVKQDVSRDAVFRAEESKRERAGRYLHYNEVDD